MAQVPNAIGGYPKLATLMGMFPEKAVFKRFGDISARNLLYLQAELLLLHDALLKIERSDAKTKGHPYARNFVELLKLREVKEDREQWDLIIKLREKLKEYGKYWACTICRGRPLTQMTEEALLRAQALADMKRPGTPDLKDLQKFLASPDIGASLIGIDSNVWGRPENPYDRAVDLVAVHTREIGDPFSRMVMTMVHPFYNYIGKHFRKADPVLGVPVYKDESMRNFARYFSTLFASAILVGSINALYFIHSMVAKLGAISAFNMAFALCLLFFAKGKPIEVFSTVSTSEPLSDTNPIAADYD